MSLNYSGQQKLNLFPDKWYFWKLNFILDRPCCRQMDTCNSERYKLKHLNLQTLQFSKTRIKTIELKKEFLFKFTKTNNNYCIYCFWKYIPLSYKQRCFSANFSYYRHKKHAEFGYKQVVIIYQPTNRNWFKNNNIIVELIPAIHRTKHRTGRKEMFICR